MRRKALCIAVIMAMILSLLPANVSFATGGTMSGSGTSAAPYLIADAADLAKIGDGAAGTFYKLSANITLSGNWTPIDTFSGILNGNGKTISGLSLQPVIDQSGSSYAIEKKMGLFTTVAKSALIKNLTIDGAKILTAQTPSGLNNTNADCGILCSENNGIITNCKISNMTINALGGSSASLNGFGAVAATNNGSVLNCSVAGTINIESQDTGVGGICSWNNGTIANCYTNVTISGQGIFGYFDSYNIGCIAGGNGGTIFNCWSDGTFTNINKGQTNKTASLAIGNNQGPAQNIYCKENNSTYGLVGIISNTAPIDSSTGTAYSVTTFNANTDSNPLNISGLLKATSATSFDASNAITIRVIPGNNNDTYFFMGDKSKAFVFPTYTDDNKYVLWTVNGGTFTYRSGRTLSISTEATVTGTWYDKGKLNEAPQTYAYNGTAHTFALSWANSPTVFATSDNPVAPSLTAATVETETIAYNGVGSGDWSTSGRINHSNHNYNVRITVPDTGYYYKTYSNTILSAALIITPIDITTLSPAPVFTLAQKIKPAADNSDSSYPQTVADITETKYGITFYLGYRRWDSTSTYFNTTAYFGKNVIKVVGSGNYTGEILLNDEDHAFYVTEYPKVLTVAATPASSVTYPHTAALTACFPNSRKLSGTMQFYYTESGKTDLIPVGDPVTCDGSTYYSSSAPVSQTVEIGSAAGELPYGTGYTITAKYVPTEAEQLDKDLMYSEASGSFTPYGANKAEVTTDSFTYTIPQSISYDGAAHSATVASNAADVTLTGVKYSKQNSDGTYAAPVTDAPKNAGTYKVSAEYTAGDNYASASGSLELGSFTISKIEPSTFTVSTDIDATGRIEAGKAVNFTINGAGVSDTDTPTGKITLSATAPDGSTVTIASDIVLNGKTATYAWTPQQLGAYTNITVAIAADDNYNGRSASCDGFTVFHYEASVSIGGAAAVTYKTFAEAVAAVNASGATSVDDAVITLNYDVSYNTTDAGGVSTMPSVPYTLDGGGHTFSVVANNAKMSAKNDVYYKNIVFSGTTQTDNSVNIDCYAANSKLIVENVAAAAGKNLFISGAPALVVRADITIDSMIPGSITYENGAIISLTDNDTGFIDITHLSLDKTIYINAYNNTGDHVRADKGTDAADIRKKLLFNYNGEVNCLVRDTSSADQYYDEYYFAPLAVTDMTVKTNPTKTSYTFGDTLDLSGLEIDLTYNNGNVETVSYADFAANGLYSLSNSDISYANGYTKGNNDISISYSKGAVNLSTTFKITVAPRLLTIDHGITEVTYTSLPISINATVKYGSTTVSTVVTYYNIDENGKITDPSATVVTPLMPGKYFYVVEATNSAYIDEYDFDGWQNKPASYIGANAADLAAKYSGCGILTIDQAAPQAQKPIYFANANISAFVTDGTVSNALTNENASTVSYKSSNENVATVAADGTVTIIGAGTTTIIAASKKDNTGDVFASYTLSVNKEPVTVTVPDLEITYGTTKADVLAQIASKDLIISKAGLSLADITSAQAVYTTTYIDGANAGRYEMKVSGLTSDKYDVYCVSGNLTVTQKELGESDFDVTAENKIYDTTPAAKLNAAVKDTSKVSGDNLSVEISGTFSDAEAADGKDVTYIISGIGGANSGNYKIKNTAISSTVKADIKKSPVTFSLPAVTTYVYDGDVKTVNVLAYANGMLFSGFTVNYGDKNIDSPTDMGTYAINIVLNDSANYETSYAGTSRLIIKSAVQSEFTIEGIGERVSYGDVIALQTAGADGDVTYAVESGQSIASLAGDQLTLTGVGSVTVSATSSKDNYTEKTVRKTFTVNKREITVSAVPVNSAQTYNGSTDVSVTVSLHGVLPNDTLTATASGSVATADAGYNKTVFVNGITLSDDTNYQLSSTSAQTSVNIEKAKITGFDVSANNKVYDATTNADAVTQNLRGIVSGDAADVTVVGNAYLDSPDIGERTLTYTANGLTGAKSGNYELENAPLQETAKITVLPAPVNFTIGTLSYVYDGHPHSAQISADINGRIFTDYTVKYNGGTNLPTDAGSYDVTIEMSDNYIGIPQGITLDIITADQKNMMITGLSGTIDYGKQFTLTATGGESTGPVQWSTSDAKIAEVDKNTGAVTVTGVGEVTITASKAADANYNPQETSVTFTTTKKAVTFKLSALSKVYDGNAQSITVTTPANVTYDVVYTDAAGNEVTGPTNAGTYYAQVTATGNYEGSANAVMTIAKAKIANVPTLAMDDGVYASPLAGAVLSTLPVGTTANITYAGTGIYTPQADVPTNAGTYTAIAEISGDNFEPVTVTKTFKIAKKELTVTADAQSRMYKAPNPVLTFTYDGFADGDNEQNALLVEPVATTNAVALSPVGGDYDITLTGGRAENYTFKYMSAKLTVTPDTTSMLTIDGSAGNVNVGAEFTLTAHYGDALPAVTWSVDDPATAQIDANGNVKMLAAGTAVFTATMNDARFGTASATFTVTAGKEEVRLFANDIVKTYNGSEQKITLYSGTSSFTVTDSNVTVVYKKDGVETQPVEAGTYIVTYEINDPKYFGSGSFTLTINKEMSNIVISKLAQTFDGTAKYVTVSGVSSYDVTYKDENDKTIISPVNAGTYFVTVTAKGNSQGTASAVLTIAKAKIDAASVTVTADNATYGDNMQAASASGNPTGTNVEITYSGSGIYTPQSDMPTNAGKYTAIAKISGDNYEDLTLTKDFEIGKATLTVSVGAASRPYGEANPDFVLSYDGFKNNDDESAISVLPQATTTASLSSPAGTYDITVSGGSADNYTFDCSAKGTLTVTPNTSEVMYIDGANKNATVGDVFTLRAHIGNNLAEVNWSSSDENIASVDENGNVTVKSSGSVTITATTKDSSYQISPATFEITASKKIITLSAANNVKVYNNDVQKPELRSNDPNFVITDENVKVTYTLTTDPSVTEAKQVGTYPVYYEINDERYSGSGTFTMYINKADIVVKAKDISRTYGDENPAYELEIVSGSGIIDPDYLKTFVTFSSGADSMGKNAKADIYEIDALVSGDSANYNITASLIKGKLTVNKAPLSVNTADVSRAYGAENPAPEVTFSGFVNNETKDVLSGDFAVKYADTITSETPAGTYKDVITADGYLSDNYAITYTYAEGTGADVTVTKIPVTVSAGAARPTYLTVVLDKAIAGLTKDNFTVKNGNETVEITDVTAENDNKNYVLKGTFSTNSTYTVSIDLSGTNYETSDTELTMKPVNASGGGTTSGGGGGSYTPTTYTVTYNTNGGNAITSTKIKRNTVLAEPTAPAKEGYTFDGWYTDAKFTAKYDFTAKVTKSFTLYAEWTEKPADNSKNEIVLTIGKKDAVVFGENKVNDVAPLIRNDRTMLPTRFVAENLGATVSWNEEEQKVTITKGDITIIIYVNSDKAYVNDKEVILDSPAFTENYRTYTPLRFISENLGATVDWNEAEQKITITRK